MSEFKPNPGEFRVARFPRALPRLVLVVASNPEEPVSIASLTTNELEFATDADVRVESGETGLRYPVLIETDLVAPIWDFQLDAPLGRLVPELHNLVAPSPDLDELDVTRRGLPLPGPWDARWAWKRQELNDLRRLAL